MSFSNNAIVIIIESEQAIVLEIQYHLTLCSLFIIFLLSTFWGEEKYVFEITVLGNGTGVKRIFSSHSTHSRSGWMLSLTKAGFLLKLESQRNRLFFSYNSYNS